jgi:hypothetical protein
LSEADPHSVYQREVCQFVGDRRRRRETRLYPVSYRDMAEVRMFLERIEACLQR